MMAVAIQRGNASYEQIQEAKEYVLAVPGPSLIRETLFCGTVSGEEVDKIRELGLELIASKEVRVPSVRKAVANIEMTKEFSTKAGDHILVVGQVRRFGVNTMCKELPLLSVGRRTRGYKLLARKGVHRIGVIKA